MTDHDEQAKIDRLNELRNNPLFPKKPKSKPETPDESLKPSEPTQLSQHIYDKLYPYFTDILNKLAGATKPLYLDSEFYINLAQAIRVERWNDNCSIKLWILINNLKSVLPKISIKRSNRTILQMLKILSIRLRALVANG